MMMLLVDAKAGTGKTTTSMFGLGAKVPRSMKLSDEQKDIIKLMRSFKWHSCAAQAFNKDIAEELKLRVPTGVVAATCNSFGNTAWLKHLGVSKIKVDAFKSNVIFREVAYRLDYHERMKIESSVCPLVNHCKNYLIDPVTEVDRVKWLADRFDLDFGPSILDFVQEVFKKGLDGSKVIDYNDQIFLPIWHGIKIPKYDLVLVDELQDLNVAKQEFAFRMAGKYIVGIGDVNQAIYGFSGADSDAMTNFGLRMKEAGESNRDLGCGGYTTLPLTITRRNPKLVVREANKYVPALRAAEDAEDGIVDSVKESTFIDDLCKDENGRMILCRVNAPLASLAFRLIARNRRCYIQGKDIGSGIKTSVKSTKEDSLDKAVGKAIEKINKRVDEIVKKPFPDETKIESLKDRIFCIQFLSDGCKSIDEFCGKVDNLFKDAGASGDHQLSSVHKAKGLERKHVCIYKPSKLPFLPGMRRNKDGSVGFQAQQEKNLTYVAYTRSMYQLSFVLENVKERYDGDNEYDSDVQAESRRSGQAYGKALQEDDLEDRSGIYSDKLGRDRTEY
jgi:superfamily I DNA/RNA helicase